MTTSSTMTAISPVAACTSSAGRRPESASTMPTTANQVMSVAANASAAPTATGRWYDCFGALHAGGDRGQHENALEPLAEDEHRNVERLDGRWAVERGRIGRTAGHDGAPHQNGEDDRGPGPHRDPTTDAHGATACNRRTAGRGHRRLGRESRCGIVIPTDIIGFHFRAPLAVKFWASGGDPGPSSTATAAAEPAVG